MYAPVVQQRSNEWANDSSDPQAEGGWRERLREANIHPETCLATDYLNHFNEAVMLLELVPEAPELLDDIRHWHPRGYQEHFRDSRFEKRELACTAYERSPDRYRIPFDLTVRTLNRRLRHAIAEVEALLRQGAGHDELASCVHGSCQSLKQLVAIAGAIINGNEVTVRDRRIVPEEVKPDGATMAQNDIDAMFD